MYHNETPSHFDAISLKKALPNFNKTESDKHKTTKRGEYFELVFFNKFNKFNSLN